MNTSVNEEQVGQGSLATPAAETTEPKATKKAKVAPRKPRVAPAKAKTTKKDHRRQERAQGQKGCQGAGKRRAPRR